MKKVRWIIPIALLFTGAATAQEISIASWNIAANKNSTTTTIENNIAAGIALLDPHLIGLSEVDSENSLDRIIDRLQTAHNLVYEKRFCERRTNLHLAILVRNGVTASEAVDVIGTSEPDPDRHRQVCAVSAAVGEFDFVFATVHYKSSGGSSNRRARVRQTTATASFLQGATFLNEKDVILVGDYNMFPSRDPDAFAALSPPTAQSPTGYLRFLTTEELCDSQANNCQGTHISNGNVGNMLDGYAISLAHTGEYVDDSFERVEMHQRMGLALGVYEDTVADHFPVVAKFETGGPDDD